MDALILVIREYIEDETSPYAVSDTIITRYLNMNRKYIDSQIIYPEDYGYDEVSKVYPVGYSFLSGVTLEDGDENTISASDYTLDVFNGLVTFDDAYTIPDNVYITFNYHDFYEVVSKLWLYRAARAQFTGKAKLADEDIPLDKYNREYCIMKYWDFMQSKNLTIER